MNDRENIIRDFAEVINRHSLENESNTPDFILAEYLVDSLDYFARASNARQKWFGKSLKIEYTTMGGMLETAEEARKREGYGFIQND